MYFLWTAEATPHLSVTQRRRERKVSLLRRSAPPSEVHVVPLYQRNVPASKEQFKVWTWKIRAAAACAAARAPRYCLRPSSPPAEGRSSPGSSADERL